MLRIHTTIGSVDYYFASEPLDYDNKYWEPRIVDSFSLIRYFQMSENTGNRIRTINIELGNHDNYFDTLQTNYGLLNQKFTLYYDDGSNVTKKFVGRVNKIDSYGSTIRLTLREIGYEYLDTPFPDAQIAYDYYSENGINESWNAVPIHFGYVYRFPLAWINLALSQFMVGSGPIYKVSKVYFNKEIVYDEASGINGYKPTNDSRNIKVRIYRGTGSSGSPEIVDGIESDWPGFSYVEFYYEDDGTPAVPLLTDGATAQVYADIQGIQNSVDSAPERNPAQIIYNILTKPTTEYEGYGLGINSGDVDFSSAIAECATQAFYIDGTINQKQNFGIWLDELLRSCRGILYEEDGKIKLTIDSSRDTVAAAFDESGENGYNCFVEPWTEPELEAQINRMKLSYDLEAESGKFRKKPAVNEESPLGDTNLINSTHATRIGKWNTSEIEFRLISDDHTAHKLAQYYFKKGILQLKRVKLTVENGIPSTLDAGNLITITAGKYGWSAKTFLIEQIEKTEEHTIIDAREYDSSVYTYTPITPASSPEQNPYSAYTKPNKPEMTSLTLYNDILSDGTTQTRLNFQFVKPINNVMQIAVFYKLNTEPESSFKAIGSTIDENLDIIWQGLNSGNYNFRAVSISHTGLMSDLGIESGDKHYYGQPNTEAYLTITADQIAPGVPIISSIVPTTGGVTIYLDVTGGIPDDFSHFKIYRKIGSGSEELIEDRWTTQLFNDNEHDPNYEARSYSAIAVDKTGNASSQSTYSSSVNPLRVGNADITTSEQIIAKDFRTALNAGNGVISGIVFNSIGFQAWNGATNTFNINAVNGNVNMTGTICALCGVIGGFTISSTEGLYAGNGNTRVQMKPDAGFWAGATTQIDAPFSVTPAGALKSTSGTIGGWIITPNYLCHSVSTGGIALYSTCQSIFTRRLSTDYGEWIGQTYNNGIWTGRYGLAVTRGVNVYVFRADTDINGNNACNQIAGWNFNSACLYSGNLILNSAGAISANYIAGSSGWKIDCTGNAEFNNICARGAIKTTVFIKDQISIIGGCTMIRPAGVSVYDCNPTSDSFNVYLNNEVNQFAIGDLVRIKDGLNDYWGCVINCGCNTAGCYVNLNIKSGTRFNFTKGQAIVNYGSYLGCGGIILNGQCPYIDLYTHDGAPWTSTTSRIRIGNLCGWGSFSTPTYGIAAGCPTGQYMTYDSLSGIMSIKGDIEVLSNGNILPDPDFRDVKYAASYLPSIPSGTIIGEYVTHTGVSSDIATVHRTSICAIYAKSNSNALRLYAANNTTYAKVYSLNFIPVQCNATYTLSGYLAKEGTNAPRAFLGLEYYDINRTYICYDYPAALDRSDVTSTPRRYSGTKVMPSNAAFVKILIYNYRPAAESWLYVSGLQLELGSVATAWKCNQGGTITANAIKSGTLTSLNWNNSTTGSCISMTDGTFKFGGSSAPKLAWDGSNLTVCGNVCATSGTFTGTICALCGVIGGFTISSTEGLYAGNGNTRVQMKADAGFWAGATTQIDAPFSVTPAGALKSTSGTIGGWTITQKHLNAGSMIISTCLDYAWGGGSIIGSSVPHIGTFYAHDGLPGNRMYLTFGQIWCNGDLTTRYGFGFTPTKSGVPFFEMSRDLNLGTLTAQIAGWNFNSACLYSGNLILNSAGAISGCYDSTALTGWCIDAAGNATFNNATIRGTVCSCSGCIGCFCINCGHLIYCGDNNLIGLYLQNPSCGICTEFNINGMYYGCYTYNVSSGCAIRIRNVNMFNCHYMTCELSNSCTGLYCCKLTYISPDGIHSNYVCNSVYICSRLKYFVTNNGSSSCFAPLQICMYSGTNCYAMCTNGAIQASHVYGYASDNYGVYGTTSCCYGVYGCASGCYGVYGTASNFGVYGTAYDFGVYGTAYNYFGVYGYASSYGVYGCASGCYGVYGCAPSYGVYGCASCCYGVYGCASCCYGVYGCAPSYGVYGYASCYSVYGHASGCYGVYGTASSYGVYGTASSYGVYGIASNYFGVYGVAFQCYGVRGVAFQCYGVYGYASCYGVYGYASTSIAVAGNGAYYNTSTRTLKQNFEDICILSGLRNICIQKWTWADANQRGFDEFVAPVAEEVQKAWGLTFKDDGYYTLDGIALKAAQEIDENVQVHESCISYLKNENIVLKSCIEQISYKLKLIEERLSLN